jgi:hypothetical protein
MPCNALAVQKGLIQVEYAKAILQNRNNQPVTNAVKQLMAETLGVKPETITYYPNGWLSSGRGNLEWVAERICLRITPEGVVEYRDGKTISNKLGAAQGKAFKETMEPLLQQLGLIMVAETMKATIKDVTDGVTRDYTMTNGTRVIEFNF